MMGFTGEKAGRIKEAYIEAFNTLLARYNLNAEPWLHARKVRESEEISDLVLRFDLDALIHTLRKARQDTAANICMDAQALLIRYWTMCSETRMHLKSIERLMDTDAMAVVEMSKVKSWPPPLSSRV